MKRLLYISVLLLMVYACRSQSERSENQLVGGPCEGCEAIFEYGDNVLSAIDTLPDFHNSKPKLKITGTVFQKDAKTPAENVILYIYHTDRQGIYKKKGDEKGWAKRHGYIRGWIKTAKDGKYTFYTFRPAAYPDGREPEHIHITVLEPNGKYYWIEDFRFKGDPILSAKENFSRNPRGGHSGIVELYRESGHWTAERNIVLGANIPKHH